jgi:hypothetical protein
VKEGVTYARYGRLRLKLSFSDSCLRPPVRLFGAARPGGRRTDGVR